MVILFIFKIVTFNSQTLWKMLDTLGKSDAKAALKLHFFG